MVAVGDASYSLYLLHPILLTIFGFLRFHNLPPDSPWLPPFLACMPVAMAPISPLWFRSIEKPIFDAVANRDNAHIRHVEGPAVHTK